MSQQRFAIISRGQRVIEGKFCQRQLAFDREGLIRHDFYQYKIGFGGIVYQAYLK